MVTMLVATGVSPAALEADSEIPNGLWEALERVGPDRKTANVRWIQDDLAEVEGPIDHTSDDRLRLQSVYECVASLIRWTCRHKRQDIHIETHGKQHQIEGRDVSQADVMRITEYVYSPCFVDQYKAADRRANDPWRSYGLPISMIIGRGGGAFSVYGSSSYRGIGFHIAAMIIPTESAMSSYAVSRAGLGSHPHAIAGAAAI